MNGLNEMLYLCFLFVREICDLQEHVPNGRKVKLASPIDIGGEDLTESFHLLSAEVILLDHLLFEVHIRLISEIVTLPRQPEKVLEVQVTGRFAGEVLPDNLLQEVLHILLMLLRAHRLGKVVGDEVSQFRLLNAAIAILVIRPVGFPQSLHLGWHIASVLADKLNHVLPIELQEVLVCRDVHDRCAWFQGCTALSSLHGLLGDLIDGVHVRLSTC
mmetsp:Transcript_29897/g.68924  ORF Transcript_29897/g.68924 Transcript_29897/m.68924 type:complete len:216 (+) Transcript_29897:333-980(+)